MLTFLKIKLFIAIFNINPKKSNIYNFKEKILNPNKMVYGKILFNNIKEYTPSFIKTVPYSQTFKPSFGFFL